MTLQDCFGNVERLGNKHTGVLPQGLIEQTLGHVCSRWRSVGEIVGIIEIGEDIAGRRRDGRLTAGASATRARGVVGGAGI